MGAPVRFGPSGRDGMRAAAAVGLALAVVVTGRSAPVSGVTPASAAANGGPPVRCADPVLPGPARGEAAVKALGASLVSVAARNGTNHRELAQHLGSDRTLWVDECGALFFQDELPADLEPAPESAEGTGWPTTVASAGAFGLHSRPGSQRVLFLDFDGHVISGTAWNTVYAQDTWTAPAFSADADPTTFSDAERAVIVDVWRRVAQDYAPFDVDVTTADPGQDAITRAGSTDALFGTRVLITPDATQSQCDCGGRAYVDVVDRTSSHASYQPAWVYPQALSNSSKYIAEAASHEAGHNFGLNHDGTQTASYYQGSGGWGPIMGSPYGQPVTQWNKGTYPGANNFQDDLVVIADNGAPLVADDVTQSGVLPLPGSVTGLVNGTLDVDTFTMTAPVGTLTVSVAPHWPGPNLDTALTVRDSNGVLVASSSPVYDATTVQASVGASVAAAVAAGSYSVSVEGAGNGVVGSAGESDYGSVGWYTLTASMTGAVTPPPTSTTPPTSETPTVTQTVTPTETPTVTQTVTPTVTPTPTSTNKVPPGKPGSATGEELAPLAVLSVATSALPSAARKKPYRATLDAAGGSGPYTWKRSKGSLPKGLGLSKSGTVSGRAKSTGVKRFRVRVTDSAGATSMKWMRIRVR